MKNTCMDGEFILEPDVYKKMLADIIDAGVFGNKTLDRIKSRYGKLPCSKIFNKSS